MEINEEYLKELLLEAFYKGYDGYKELAEQTVDRIVDRCKEKTKVEVIKLKTFAQRDADLNPNANGDAFPLIRNSSSFTQSVSSASAADPWELGHQRQDNSISSSGDSRYSPSSSSPSSSGDGSTESSSSSFSTLNYSQDFQEVYRTYYNNIVDRYSNVYADFVNRAPISIRNT